MAAKFDLSALVRISRDLRATPAQAERVVQRARSTLLRRLPVAARRDIAAEYNLRAARIREGLRVTASASSVELIGAKRGIGLIEYSGRWAGPKSEGAVARVRVDEAPHTYGGSFIATGRSGNRQIFDRVGVGGKRRPRLPIAARYGVSIAQALRRPGRADRLADLGREILAAESARLLKV